MATSRPVAGINSGTSAPTSETVVGVLIPGQLNPPSQPVLVRADLVLVGAVSVTAMTMRIRRGPTTAGAVIAAGAFTVTGAQTVPGNLSVDDTAYDGTGYCLTVQATGAAGTCGPGTLEAQPVAPGF